MEKTIDDLFKKLEAIEGKVDRLQFIVTEDSNASVSNFTRLDKNIKDKVDEAKKEIIENLK